MAEQYTNRVPRGTEGTGAATIFGANRALSYFMGEIGKQEQKLEAQQQAYQKKQQAYNDTFQKDLYKLNELAQTPMYSQDFNNLTTTLMKQGGELMAQGINPYNPNQSPEAREAVANWQSSVNKLTAAKANIEEIHKQRNDLIKKIQENPTEYDQEELKKLYDFEKNYSLDDIIKGQRLPEISKNFDINANLVKEVGEIKTEGGGYTTDANGNPMYQEYTQADTNRIAQIVNSRFNDPSSPYYQAVNRRMRKEFGEGADLSGLIGVTDKNELRSIIDGEFRNNDTSRQLLAELKVSGKNIDYNSPEYKKLLDKAVDEQYKAEVLFDNIKQDAANTLIGKVNTKEKAKFDFTLRDQQMQEQSHARSIRNSDATYQGTVLSNTKKIRELNGESFDGSGSQGTTYIPAVDTKGNNYKLPSINTENVNFPVSAASTYVYDLGNGGLSEQKGGSIKGNVVGFYEVPVRKGTKGSVVVQEGYASRNADKVVWEKTALVRDAKGNDVLIPIEAVKSNLPKEVRKTYNNFVNKKSATSKQIELEGLLNNL